MEKTERMLAIEEEFGGDIRDIIQDLRQMQGGNSWYTVAGILDVCPRTLRDWRRRLEMPIKGDEDRIYDPCSFEDGKRPEHCDHRAQELGYENMLDAVLHLALVEQITRTEAAERLGCHPQSITNHTPEHLRGQIWRQQQYEPSEDNNWWVRGYAQGNCSEPKW